MTKVRTYSNSKGHYMEIEGSTELLVTMAKEFTKWWDTLEFTFHNEKVVISNFSNVAEHIDVQFQSIITELGINEEIIYGPEFYNQRISEVYIHSRRLFISNERNTTEVTLGKNSPTQSNEVVHYPDEHFVFKLFSFSFEDTVLIPMDDEIMGYRPEKESRISIPNGLIVNLPFFPTMVIIHGKNEAQEFFRSFVRIYTKGIHSNSRFVLPKEGESKLFYL